MQGSEEGKGSSDSSDSSNSRGGSRPGNFSPTSGESDRLTVGISSTELNAEVTSGSDFPLSDVDVVVLHGSGRQQSYLS